MSATIKQTREEAAGAKLRQNPPCMLCEQPRSQHPKDKCLFGATKFKQPSALQLRIYLRWGTYTRHLRGGRNYPRRYR